MLGSSERACPQHALNITEDVSTPRLYPETGSAETLVALLLRLFLLSFVPRPDLIFADLEIGMLAKSFVPPS